MGRVEEFNKAIRRLQQGQTQTTVDRKAAFAEAIGKKKEEYIKSVLPGTLDAARNSVASTWFKGSDDVGGLDRTEYHDNPHRASNHVAEMGNLREERAAEKQWYDKYSNLNVDLAAAAQRAAEAGQKNVQDEIYQLTQQANLYFSNNMEEERAEALKRLEYLEGLDVESSARLQQLRQDIATAQYLQKQQMYAGKQAEADTYAASQPTSGRWSAEEIDRKIQETDNRLQMLNASGQFEEADALKVELDRLYQLRRVSEYGQDSERNLYDYLQSEDPAEAQAYLQHLQETMNYRKGMEQVSDIRGIDNDVLRTLAIGAHSVGTGMANAGAGFNQLFSEEAIPTTAMQYASEELMGELGTVGRLLYSAGSTVGNMLPTILLSVGLGAVGVPGAMAGGIASTAMGASVAGNTYTQAVKEGYAPDKAKTYAALIGASEAALQYLLGGIGKLGGVADDAILAKVKTIDNVLARMALTGAVKIGREVGEEELQLFLEPAIRSVVFSEGYNVPQMEEIIETAVVSALSTGLLEGPGIISAGFEHPDMGSNPVQTSESAVDPVMAQAAEMLKRDGAKKTDGEPLASAPAAAAEVPQTSSAQKNAPPSAVPAVLQNEQVQDTEVANAVLRSAAKGFGKEGAQNLLLAYDGQSSTNYLGGFQVYYEAGLSGRGMDKVESVFSGYLTDNQKQLAYGAGQIDAARSLEAEIGAVASATVYGKEAGLVRNQEAAKLDRTVASSLNKLGKATGVKILVEDMAEGVNGSFDVKSGIIRLNAKATNPLLTVAAHEVTHRMQQMSPKEYRAFRDFAVNAISEQIGSSAIREIEARYARNDVKLTHEEAMDEVAAEFAEAMVKDETLFRKLTQENRTAAQKFVDAVKAFIEKVKAAFSKDSKTQDSHAMQKYGVDMQTLEAAAKKWEAALEATEKAVQGKENTASEGGEVRYSIKDVNGKSVVWIENSALSNKDLESHKAVANFIAQHIGEVYTIIESGQKVYIGDDLPDEFTQSTYTSYLRDRDRKLLKAKNKMVNDFGLLIETATNRRWEKTKHAQTKDAKYGIYRYDASFAFPTKDRSGTITNIRAFDVELIIRNASDGKKYLYDIVGIKENTASAIDLMNRETRKGSYAASQGGVYNTSIHDNDGNSNNQFSLSDHGELNAAEIKAVMQENAMLKERVDYWKGQTKRTTKPTMDKKAVAKAARDLVKEYGADVDIAEDLQSLYNDIVSGKDGDGEMTGEAAFRRAADIAAQLVENAVAKDDTLYQEYADLRQFLRSTKLVISEEASHDIPDFGDFRKAHMGRISVGKGKSNIQEIYKDLAEDYPAFFDEQRTVTESDQLLEIAEVMEKIYTVTEYNPYSRYMEQAVTGTANEILEKFFDLPETKPTFADRQAKAMQDLKDKAGQRLAKERADHAQRLQELRQQNRQKVQEAIQKERDRRVKEVDNLKSQYAARDLKGRERRNARELRAKITRHAKALSQKLLKPTDKQHVPENLRGAVAMLLDAINLESQYTVTPDGKRVKGGDGNPTKRTEAFMRLRQEYEKITKSDQPYNLVIDPDLMDNLVELSEMRDIRLADMNTEQLATVWAALRAVEASIQTANKAFGASRFETISEFAEGIRADNRGRNDRGNLRSGIPDKMDKLVNVDMLTPEAYFHRLGGTASEIFRMLRNAQDQHIRIMEKAKRATFKITRSSNIEKLEKEIHHVKLSGDRTVTMSTAQIMSLYELLKREQAQDHILVGGIRPDALEQKGLKQVNRAEPYQVTLEDCMEICGVLTKEQQEMADKLQQYLGNELSELGNQASMEVYGYRKFNEPNYFPIKVDQNQTKSDVAKQAQAATIAGRGFTKATAPKAKNAVMISSIFDVYAAHVNDMATYAAWLAPMENLRRIRDFSFWTDGVQIGNVKAIVERVFGKHGNTYLNKLIDDINQGVQAKDGSNLTDGLTGNYKAASVALNLRVVLQQPTAILRALDMVNPKYLAKGVVKKGDFEKVKKYAPIAIWKDWGYFDINTGRQMKNVLFDYDSGLDKVKQWTMAPAGKADSFAWARLWNALEAEIRDTRKDLQYGSDAFYRAVAERFAEVVDRTQVVDGILQRSQIMRSPDSLKKMATSFMGEPTKTYNMFLSAAFDLKHAKGKDQRKAAGKTLARTTISLVVSFAFNAVVQSIVDALRDDDKERRYMDKWLSAYFGFTGEEEVALDYWNSFWSGNLQANFNPLGYIPYAKDLVSIAQGYDVARMDMEPVSRVWDAASQMYKTLSGEGKYSFAGASANLLAEASRLLGIPVANVKREIHGALMTIAVGTDNYLLQYRIDKALLNMGYAQNKKNFMDILYNAMMDDEEAYRIIVADMVRNGMSVEDIRKAMEERMKKAQGVQSVDELANRYLTPEQTKVYDSMHSGVSGTTVWDEATAEQRAKAEANMYNVIVGNHDGLEMQEKIAAGAEIGLTETEFILYQLAKEVVGDGNNNTSQAEAKQAINMLKDLSREERAFLWASTNKDWKPENNPYQ